MQIKGKIPGEILQVSSATVEDLIDLLQGTKGFIEKDFYDEYQFHIIMKQRIARAAKVFLINNWEKVKDWSKMNVTIRDNSKKRTEYFNHVPRIIEPLDKPEGAEESIMHQMVKMLDEHDDQRHNPIISLTRMVLDPTDCDFSLTINGKDHLWIHDDSVIVIADYAEKQTKAQQS